MNSPEDRERIVALAKGDRGERGEQGEQGEQGKRGLPRGLARAIVYLFAVNTALVILGYVLIINAVHQAQESAQAAEQHAGLVFERQLCLTFGKAAALKPPAGNPQKNPSRAYLQGQHVVWVEVVGDLRCNHLS